MSSPPEKILKQALSDLKEPIVFKNLLQGTWEILQWSVTDIIDKFGDLQLPFRIGFNAKTANPQWDFKCQMKEMTLKEFMEQSYLDTKLWYYFDYKYMNEWLKDKSDILNAVNWSRFGLDKTGFDSTIWIGSKGAHTNCHQDSYGCNLVAQTHGRKVWLLFPPNALLHPTRIPYEESTIYSKFNFFCPTNEDKNAILINFQQAKQFTLEPGDVLFIPKGWWHYVESLDLSISVNIWLPEETDNQSRLKEALVKLIMTQIGSNIPSSYKESQESFMYCLNLVKVTLSMCNTNNENEEIKNTKKSKHSSWSAEDLIRQYPDYVKSIRSLSLEELENVLTNNQSRFKQTHNEKITDENSCKSVQCDSQFDIETSETVVNAFCHPEVIDKVANILMNSML